MLVPFAIAINDNPFCKKLFLKSVEGGIVLSFKVLYTVDPSCNIHPAASFTSFSK